MPAGFSTLMQHTEKTLTLDAHFGPNWPDFARIWGLFLDFCTRERHEPATVCRRLAAHHSFVMRVTKRSDMFGSYEKYG